MNRWPKNAKFRFEPIIEVLLTMILAALILI